MFGLFRSRENSPEVKDVIWISEKIKFQKMLSLLKENPSGLIFITWFDETTEMATRNFNVPGDPPVYAARQAHSSFTKGKRVIFLEHHPDSEKESQLYRSLGIDRPEVWSALDEPIFKSFGSDRIIGLMKQLGMNEDEAIEHSLISSSIRKAQKKIASKKTGDNHASSQAEWLAKNVRN